VTGRDAMLHSTGQKDCWSALRAIGAEGVEAMILADLTLPGLFHPTVKYTVATAAGTERLAADAKAAGQRITAFCMMNRFEELETKWCGEVARAAQALGVPAVRIDVAPAEPAQPEFLKLAAEALRKIIVDTKPTGMAFAIENHGTTTNDPAFLGALFDKVGSQRLGLTLDTANFYWFGHPLSKVYELYETFATRVFHTHCKNIRYPAAEREKRRPMGWKYAQYACPIDEGDIDFARVAAILHKGGYKNDLCIEDESLFSRKPSADEATRQLAGEAQLLKTVVAKLPME
jgi:sugar phosphate isomerase/epimerase